MGNQKEVARHYTRGTLEETVLRVLRSAGKDLERLRPGDLGGLDDFHVGGWRATEAVGGLLEVREGMRLLDVGCGLGGPARYFAQRGCRVTGIDLTDEFVRVAEGLTRLVGLEERTQFRVSDARALDFDTGTFDGAYMLHVGMNIEDKAGVFREVARVVKRGGRFAIFDILRDGGGAAEYPLPWASGAATDFAAGIAEYREALAAAGFRVHHERGRREFGIAALQRAMEHADSVPRSGLELIMGKESPAMTKNLVAEMERGALEPVELAATRD